MKIVSVILNWNRPELTVKCVRSLQEHAGFVIPLVVDNGSSDDSLDVFASQLPGTEVIANPSNDGYAGGNNRGFGRALDLGAEAVLVLNNDVTVDPRAVERLDRALSADPSRGIVAPVSISASDPGKIDHNVATIDLKRMEVLAHDRGDEATVTTDAETDYAPGSAFLIEATLLRGLGGFDPRFFLVWEDVDLALRARAKGCPRALMVASATVRHVGSATFGDAGSPLYRYYFVRNSYLVARKHLSWLGYARARRMLDKRYEGWARSANQDEVADAIRRGAQDGRAGHFGPMQAPAQ